MSPFTAALLAYAALAFLAVVLLLPGTVRQMTCLPSRFTSGPSGVTMFALAISSGSWSSRG